MHVTLLLKFTQASGSLDSLLLSELGNIW